MRERRVPSSLRVLVVKYRSDAAVYAVNAMVVRLDRLTPKGLRNSNLLKKYGEKKGERSSILPCGLVALRLVMDQWIRHGATVLPTYL